MKKFLLLLILIILPGILAANVVRYAPTNAEPLQEITVSFTISDTLAGKEFTLEETIPSGLVLKEWTVTGAKESKSQIKTREKDGNFGWSFTTTGTTARISYTAVVSDNAPSAIQLQAVWFDTKGFNKDEYTITKGKTTTPPSASQEAQQPAQTSLPARNDVKTPAKAAGTSNSSIWWSVLLIVVIIGVGVYLYQQKTSKKPMDVKFKRR